MRRILLLLAAVAAVGWPTSASADCVGVGADAVVRPVNPGAYPSAGCSETQGAGSWELELLWTPGATGRFIVDLTPLPTDRPYHSQTSSLRVTCDVQAGLAACRTQGEVGAAVSGAPAGPLVISYTLGATRYAWTGWVPLPLAGSGVEVAAGAYSYTTRRA